MKGDANGKIWLEPDLSVAYLLNFTNAEEKIILEVANKNAEIFKTKWNEYFNK